MNIVTMVRPKILRDWEKEPVLSQELGSFVGGMVVQSIILDEIKHGQVGEE